MALRLTQFNSARRRLGSRRSCGCRECLGKRKLNFWKREAVLWEKFEGIKDKWALSKAREFAAQLG